MAGCSAFGASCISVRVCQVGRWAAVAIRWPAFRVASRAESPFRTSMRGLIAAIGLLACATTVPTHALEVEAGPRLTTPDDAAKPFFGSALAISGDTAILGAYWDDVGNLDSGSATVFVRTAGGWVQQAKLLPPVPRRQGYFGQAVAVDGETAMVASPNARTVYVFERTAGTWSLRQSITPVGSPDNFVSSVALDGPSLIVGAKFANGQAGEAYIFARDAFGNWLQQQVLTAEADAGPDQFFGSAVAIDGNTAVVGSPNDRVGGTVTGSAYVFVRSAGGTWVRQARLTASDARAGDGFGHAVAVEGATAAVASARAGALVYVYSRSSVNWSQEARLIGGDPGLSSTFAVALRRSLILVGASVNARAFVFGRTPTGWERLVRLTPPASESRFGAAVDFDGETALVSALAEESPGLFVGSAYVYSLTVPLSKTDQFVVAQPASPMILGSAGGDDTYLLCPSLLPPGTVLTISDAEGSNSIQLAEGLDIAMSRIAADALQLTLVNGSVITVLGASGFTYEAGGNRSAGIERPDLGYAAFVEQVLGAAVPAGTTINAGPARVIGGGTALAAFPARPKVDDFVVLQYASPTVVGAAAGDDTYLLSPSLLRPGLSLTISDTSGRNSIQLGSGLSIASSRIAANALQLTLANGSVITILGAAAFGWEAGGNRSAGVDGPDLAYPDFVQQVLGVPVPAGPGIAAGGPVWID